MTLRATQLRGASGRLRGCRWWEPSRSILKRDFQAAFKFFRRLPCVCLPAGQAGSIRSVCGDWWWLDDASSCVGASCRSPLRLRRSGARGCWVWGVLFLKWPAMEVAARGGRCCCTERRRRCLRVGGLWFLVNVAPTARASPTQNSSSICRCLQEGEASLSQAAKRARPEERVERANDSKTKGVRRRETGGAKPRFTPVFDKCCLLPLCSLNAGDPRLYVGGAGINLAFKLSIDGAASQSKRVSKEWGDIMADVHSKTLQSTKNSDNRVSHRSVSDLPIPFNAVHCMLPDEETTRNFQIRLPEGAVFLDIFDSDCNPEGNVFNAAMLYAVGPRGWLYTAERFYGTVRLVAGNAFRLVLRFNSETSVEKRLRIVRFPLISGGAFIGPHNASSVASAIVKGILDAAEEHFQKCKPEQVDGPLATTKLNRLKEERDTREDGGKEGGEKTANQTSRKRRSSDCGEDAESADPLDNAEGGFCSCSVCSCCQCSTMLSSKETEKANSASEGGPPPLQQLPVVEFALVEGDLFWEALLKEYAERKGR